VLVTPAPLDLRARLWEDWATGPLAPLRRAVLERASWTEDDLAGLDFVLAERSLRLLSRRPHRRLARRKHPRGGARPQARRDDPARRAARFVSEVVVKLFGCEGTSDSPDWRQYRDRWQLLGDLLHRWGRS
jgi:hypothetical protein